MKKLIAGVGLTLALALTTAAVVLAPSASADTTGPDSAACATANAGVLADALAANALAQSVDGQQDAVLIGLKAAVKDASDKVDAANTAFQVAALVVTNAGGESKATTTQIKARDDALIFLNTAQDVLDKAAANLANGPKLTPAQKAELADAQAKVSAAIAVRLAACTAAVVTTTTAAPTTTVVPTTTVATVPTTTEAPATTTVQLPAAIDTGRA